MVFITCCVRENAENRALGNVAEMKRLKERNPGMIIGIAGCMVQQEGIREHIVKRMPWVDLVFGTHNIHNLPALLSRVEMGERVIEVLEAPDEMVEDLPAIRAYRHKAFVNITFGCDNYCTTASCHRARRSAPAQSTISSPRYASSWPTAAARSPCWGRT